VCVCVCVSESESVRVREHIIRECLYKSSRLYMSHTPRCPRVIQIKIPLSESVFISRLYVSHTPLHHTHLMRYVCVCVRERETHTRGMCVCVCVCVCA